MGACFIQHFQYDFRLLYLGQVSRLSLYKNKKIEKLKVIETLMMLKYQIIFSVVYFTLFIFLFFVGKYNGLIIQNNPESLFSKFVKVKLWIFGFIIFGILIFILKRNESIKDFYEYLYFGEYQFVIDGDFVSALFILSIGLMAPIEGGYRLVFKKKYEDLFYALVTLSVIFTFYICVFVVLPGKIFLIGTYDGHLNPKIVKMIKEEGRQEKYQIDLNLKEDGK